MSDVTVPMSKAEEEQVGLEGSGFESGAPTEADLQAYLRGELLDSRPQ